ncbi:MAG: MupG family TIM beta-alpha barrel fold protein, partial [Kurthia sp.]
MKRLGISLYPQHSELEVMQQYILAAAQHGFDRIFTCFMSIKDEEEMSKMKSILLFAKKNGFEISADLAPTVLEEMNLTYRDIHVLKEQFHLSAIRLDMGFSGQEEAFMSVDDSNLAI